MVNALSTRPVCGANESFEMKEVSELMRQYEAGELVLIYLSVDYLQYRGSFGSVSS